MSFETSEPSAKVRAPGCLYLTPLDFDDLSGEFTLQSGWKVLFHTDVGESFQDGHRRLCQDLANPINLAILSQPKQLKLCVPPPRRRSKGQRLPLTVSLARVRTPSAEKTIVPVSSSARLDSVRPWTRPLLLTRHWLFGFTLMPSFCQIPSTSVCESSTSKEAVSRSKVSWSDKPLRMEILRAGQEEMGKKRIFRGEIAAQKNNIIPF